MLFTASGEMVFPILINSKSTKIEMLGKECSLKTFCHFFEKRNQLIQFFPPYYGNRSFFTLYELCFAIFTLLYQQLVLIIDACIV